MVIENNKYKSILYNNNEKDNHRLSPWRQA